MTVSLSLRITKTDDGVITTTAKVIMAMLLMKQSNSDMNEIVAMASWMLAAELMRLLRYLTPCEPSWLQRGQGRRGRR